MMSMSYCSFFASWKIFYDTAKGLFRLATDFEFIGAKKYLSNNFNNLLKEA